MKLYSLSGAWHARVLFPSGESFSMEAAVPGCAIADLIRADKLPRDVFFRDNAEAVRAFEACDYVYTTECCLDTVAEDAVLSFERLDTYAEVRVGGVTVYTSENGNIRHDIPVGGRLTVGKNTVEVVLRSPIRAVEGRPAREGAFTTERLYTRRMQCTYGWDWVGRFVTVGIGACTLTVYDTDEAVCEHAYITTADADADSATVRIDTTFRGAYRGERLTFSVLAPDGTCVASRCRYLRELFARTELDVPSPRLWYPRGYGEQPLYTFTLTGEDGRVLYTERFGIRTVKIQQLPDAEGSAARRTCERIQNPFYDRNGSSSSFLLKINGTPIFCKGANWVPCEPFVTEGIEEKQTALLEACAAGGVNMLRVWGGGAFETRHFYSECSRLGLLVTQDFLMACGAYPEEDDRFIEELQREALYAARLMRNQPCLVWWTGDNENAVDGCDTDESYRGRRSAYDGIAPILYREDPSRRFLPSSPYGGDRYASNTVGTTHNTQYLGDMLFPYMEKGDASDYKEEFKKYRARFIAEEPQLGAIPLASLRRFLTDADIFENDEMLLYHTKGNPALSKELYTYMTDFAQSMLGKFTDGTDRLFKLRYLQYEWIRVVVEQARRDKALCSGIILWMMNDCWPAAAGWSLIDYYGRPKEGYYAFRRAAAPVIASIDREAGVTSVYVSNDSPRARTVCGTLTHLAADRKTVKASYPFTHTAEACSSAVALTAHAPLPDGELLICELTGDGVCDRTFYQNGALTIRPSEGVTLSVNEQAHTVTLTASEYVHAVLLDGEAIFEDSGFSLLCGEVRTLSYKPTAEGAAAPTATAYTLL